MRKSLMILAAVTFALAHVAGPAAAHWDDTMPYKMHYPQLPDTSDTGWDVRSSQECCVADDWRCAESGWIKDIHFWGSWFGDVEGEITRFHFVILSNDPGPPSMPAETLWTYDVALADVHVEQFATALPWEGWWDPCADWWEIANHQIYYQYNVYIPEGRWFCQEAGSIYWLGIWAEVDGTEEWGWKTSMSPQFTDDAVYGFVGGWWAGPLTDPISGDSRDLAFVLTGDNVPPSPNLPTASEWALIILALLLAAAGTIALIRRRRVAGACL